MSAASRRRAFRVVTLMLLTAAAVPASAPASAQTVVQSFDPLRDGPPNPFATLGFVVSPYYSAVRAAAAANLGGLIMFGTPEHPDGVSAITPEVLAGTDIFVVTGMNLALSTEEACLLDAYVAGGGAVFAFRNEWMPTRLLGTALDGFGGTGYAQVTDVASPLVAGPFGLVASPVRVGANSGYAADAGWAVLADGGRPMLLAFDEATGHRGRAVVVGDEEIFLNGPTPFGGDLHGTRANNQILFANILDWLAAAPGLDAAGLDALQACVMSSCPDTPGGGLPTVGDPPADGGEPADLDHDGVPAGQDCDDLDAAAHPGAVDLPGNPVDEDCDGGPACDPGAVWNSHGDFVSCVAREASALVADEAISLEQGRALIREAARGETGMPTGRASVRGRR